MDQSQLLRYLIETLETLSIDYMLGGSQASIYYGEGGSDKHLRDIAGMLAISGQEIDCAYISEWAGKSGIEEIWQAVNNIPLG